MTFWLWASMKRFCCGDSTACVCGTVINAWNILNMLLTNLFSCLRPWHVSFERQHAEKKSTDFRHGHQDRKKKNSDWRNTFKSPHQTPTDLAKHHIRFLCVKCVRKTCWTVFYAWLTSSSWANFKWHISDQHSHSHRYNKQKQHLQLSLSEMFSRFLSHFVVMMCST